MGSPLTAGIVTSAGVDRIADLVRVMGGDVTGERWCRMYVKETAVWHGLAVISRAIVLQMGDCGKDTAKSHAYVSCYLFDCGRCCFRCPAGGIVHAMGPAAVSDLVKTVNSDNIGQLVAHMGPELAAAVVHNMGVDLTVELVQKLGPEVAAGIVKSAGGSTTGALVRAMGADFVAELVTKLGITENVALVADLGPGTLVSLTAALGPVFIASLSVSLSSELFSALFGSMSSAGASALGMDARTEGGVPPGSSDSRERQTGDYVVVTSKPDAGYTNISSQGVAAPASSKVMEVPVVGSNMTTIVDRGGMTNSSAGHMPVSATPSTEGAVKIIPAVPLRQIGGTVQRPPAQH